MRRFIVHMLMVSLVSFLINGCALTSTRLEVLKPAEIDIPSDIKSVAIANRSLASNYNYRENVIEGFITQEPIYADRDGSYQAIRGAAAKLNQSPRFTAVILEGMNLYGTGTRTFAPPISWAQVEQICRQFNTDALILLEAFDSNLRLEKSQRKKKEKKDSVEIEVTEYTARLFIDIEGGWRIYDVRSHRIIDHNNINFGKNWTGTGKTPQAALKNLPPVRELITQAGYLSGEMYAAHISPVWMNVSRSYYKKGSTKLKNAAKFAKAGDWETAGSIWATMANSNYKKEAERACYNMILFYEIRGDYSNAMDWAREAVKTHGNKKASDYIRILNQRIADEKRLNNQLH